MCQTIANDQQSDVSSRTCVGRNDVQRRRGVAQFLSRGVADGHCQLVLAHIRRFRRHGPPSLFRLTDRAGHFELVGLGRFGEYHVVVVKACLHSNNGVDLWRQRQSQWAAVVGGETGRCDQCRAQKGDNPVAV